MKLRQLYIGTLILPLSLLFIQFVLILMFGAESPFKIWQEEFSENGFHIVYGVIALLIAIYFLGEKLIVKLENETSKQVRFYTVYVFILELWIIEGLTNLVTNFIFGASMIFLFLMSFMFYIFMAFVTGFIISPIILWFLKDRT
jgi:hypothetical protein